MTAAVPDPQLAHLLEHGSDAGGGFNRYALYPITVPRPPAGRTVARIECGECGQVMDCTMYSVEATRRLRARWHAGAVLSALLTLAVAGAMATTIAALLPDRPASTPVAWLLALGFPALPGLGYLAVRAYRSSRREAGIRLGRDAGSHTLRPPGATFEHRYNTEGGE